MLSGCGLILNDLLENSETTKTIDFQIIYQGFYYEFDGNRIFGNDFNFGDLISVSIEPTSTLTFKDKTFYFSNNDESLIVYSRNDLFYKNIITPLNLIIEEQASITLNLDLKVKLTYEATINEEKISTDLTLAFPNNFITISTNTADVSSLKLIIGLDSSGNLVYDLLKNNNFYSVDASLDEGIYYVTNQNIFYSTLSLGDSTSIIYYPNSWNKIDSPYPY